MTNGAVEATAIADALAPLGVRVTDFPRGPARVLDLILAARDGAARAVSIAEG